MVACLLYAKVATIKPQYAKRVGFLCTFPDCVPYSQVNVKCQSESQQHHVRLKQDLHHNYNTSVQCTG